MALTTQKVKASVTPPQKASQKPLSSGRKYAWLTFNYLLMILLAIFFLFPTVFMMVSSLKTDENQLLQDLSSVNAFIPYGAISLRNFSWWMRYAVCCTRSQSIPLTSKRLRVAI